MKNKVKIKDLKLAKQLIGKKLSNNFNGDSGRDAERLLEGLGVKINRGAGPDILFYGLEVKTRKISATSAQTVCVMSPDSIIATEYYNSPVYSKFQQQLRIKINDDDVIVEVDVYDFDQPQIQCLVKDAYDNARRQITKDPDLRYTPYKGFWGYFEATRPESTSLDFRFSAEHMEKLETMAKSTFNNIFEYEQ